mmetsp:Transcript_28964/g.33067  ORF Transcript_28964/g.33067 Transcript_28964/m.33067 type:complete len:95 (-) Transcript_28964:23-307(-)
MLDENLTDKVAERCVYKADGNSTLYEAFLYKDPGWKSFLRRKAYSWGIERMTTLLAKEKEILSKRKEQMLKQKEKIIKKKEELISLKSKFTISK